MKTKTTKQTTSNGRPYSLAYTAAGTPRRYLLSGIPAQLWISFSARAKREHIAKRQVLLQLVETWTDRPERALPGGPGRRPKDHVGHG